VPKPHGGKLVNRVLEGKAKQKALPEASRLPQITLSEEQVKEVVNIATGTFSPLEGFLGQRDYLSVLDQMRLADDLPWTIPIILDIREQEAGRLKEGDDAALVDEALQPVAILHLEEKYSYDRDELAEKVFGTLDRKHPGVAKVYRMGEVLLGGKVDLIEEPQLPFDRYHLKPVETRILFQEKGWRTVAGFQTRNVPHLGHEYVQKTALAFVDGLFINPVIGKKKSGDFRDEVILDSYATLIEHYYLKDSAVLAILPMEMRYAGPREAIFHAIVRKNFGCTHFIVGRDHAGVGDYYSPYAAQDIFEQFPDLGITPLFFKSFFYCRKCESITNDKTCPHDDSDHINFSGTKIRELLSQRQTPPKELMRAEVAEIILSHDNLFVE